MKRFFVTTALFLWAFTATAQIPAILPDPVREEGRAPRRTEFISYDVRAEADAGMLAGSKYHRALPLRSGDGMAFETTVEIPGLWLDRDVWIRDTGRTGRYLLTVNGQRVGYNTDSYSVGEFHITPYLREGDNLVAIQMLAPGTAGSDMERFTPDPARRTIDNLYIFSQPRLHIFDYTVSGHHDDEFKDTVIDLAVVVENGFNMAETVRVGYDVFDPAGNLREYAFVEAEIPGRGRDTVRFYNKVTGTEKFQYSASNPALYRVVLSLRHGGRNTEYIPLRLGFGLTSYDGERVSRAGAPVAVKATEGDFPTRTRLVERLRALKREGYNTVSVTRPQQRWFYEAALAEGIYVIDRAAVECDPRGGDRSPGGTVANDPSYISRFLDRQRAMYYRGRNYPNIIGWAIGSESGNGYNMYKSYELLKSLDPTRPVLYPWAGGEWNSDTIDGY
jgi:beta-galactosidase